MPDSTMRAVLAEKGALHLRDVPRPLPRSNEALVAVRAVSLNRGELKVALNPAMAGYRPGWDAAGVVLSEAADGSGPPAGTRVAGLAPFGAWAEFVALRTEMLAPLPDAVSYEQAASLPVAGLTALHALAKGGLLVGREVLVTGATGGVGTFALQIAHAAGATVTAAIRDAAQSDFVRSLGAHRVATEAELHGPYHLILESVGGTSLAHCMNRLAPGGSCVLFGASEAALSTIDMSGFRIGGTTLYGLVMQYELLRDPPRIGLPHLMRMIVDGTLSPVIGLTSPLAQIGHVALALLERSFPGKAILTV